MDTAALRAFQSFRQILECAPSFDRAEVVRTSDFDWHYSLASPILFGRPSRCQRSNWWFSRNRCRNLAFNPNVRSVPSPFNSQLSSRRISNPIVRTRLVALALFFLKYS